MNNDLFEVGYVEILGHNVDEVFPVLCYRVPDEHIRSAVTRDERGDPRGGESVRFESSVVQYDVDRLLPATGNLYVGDPLDALEFPDYLAVDYFADPVETAGAPYLEVHQVVRYALRIEFEDPYEIILRDRGPDLGDLLLELEVGILDIDALFIFERDAGAAAAYP